MISGQIKVCNKESYSLSNLRLMAFVVEDDVYAKDIVHDEYKQYDCVFRKIVLDQDVSSLAPDSCLIYSYSWSVPSDFTDYPVNAGNLRVVATLFDSSGQSIQSACDVDVIRSSSSISCSISSQTLDVGEAVTVSGSVDPAHGGAEVTLHYTGPEGSVVTRTTTSDADGRFEGVYSPEQIGSWTEKASWAGDGDHEGAESSSISFTVEKPPAELPLIIYILMAMIVGAGVATIIPFLLLRRRQRALPRSALSSSLTCCKPY